MGGASHGVTKGPADPAVQGGAVLWALNLSFWRISVN